MEGTEMEESILGYALQILLIELGCSIKNTKDTATITYGKRRLKLEKRGDNWYSLEKDLLFTSRSHIVFYMIRDEMREITIRPDEQYGGHWIMTDTKTYYFLQGTTLTQVFDMLEDEDNVGKR
jgi:hypothetical protein